MKTLLRLIAAGGAAVMCVLLAQRLFRRLYTDIGTKYIVINEDLKGA